MKEDKLITTIIPAWAVFLTGVVFCGLSCLYAFICKNSLAIQNYNCQIIFEQLEQQSQKQMQSFTIECKNILSDFKHETQALMEEEIKEFKQRVKIQIQDETELSENIKYLWKEYRNRRKLF